MDEINRNTTEVIMQIHNLFRYADPVFRLGAIGAIKLIQFFARMVREKKLSAIEFEDFGKFLKVTEGKYDIMNIPAMDKDQLLTEMKSLDIHYMIMPDLNKEDGLMQVAVYQPDREKFGSWYERYLIGRMQGGEKELKELRSLTRGNVSIVSFPLEGREEGMQEHILMVPLEDVFEADGGKTYIAFLDKKHLPFTLQAGDGKPATEYFGMSTTDLAKQFFKEIEEAELTPERVMDPAKSLAETVTIHIKQPTPPIKVR